MADESLYDRVHELTDLELAALLSLINREHCLISTPEYALDDLVAELQLIATKTFDLSPVVIECDASTTLEDFASALLVPNPQSNGDSTPTYSAFSSRLESYFTTTPRQARPSASSQFATGSLRIANVVLAKNLDQAPASVQIQALELLRTRRIFTRTSVQTAPKQFLFIPVLSAESGGKARVLRHLNDFLFVAHWHDPEQGFVNVEDEQDEGDAAGTDDGTDDDTASTGSVVKRATPGGPNPAEALISENDIDYLANLSKKVQVDVDIVRYQMNIVSFLRMHRAVADGISPAATKHFERLTRCLAPLHKLDYITPALVGLAVKKVYLHRISITPPDKERSMQWGSKLEAVESVLADVGPEEVIDDVLELVTAPI